MDVFKIDCTDLEWLSDPDHEQEDLCLHGKVTAWIGDESKTMVPSAHRRCGFCEL